MIGEMISHYKILEKLGEGGMGVVYKARDTRLDRIVALKFLSPRTIVGDNDKARLIREAKAAAALSHPGICMIHEIGEDAGRSFVAMELIDGPDLEEKMESGRFEIDEAIDIAIKVAEGLSEAHRAGTVHRDIKPANIMITSRNAVKIMDFGLAKSTGKGSLAETGSLVGTLAYMSPEQIRARETDHRTDLFSLGMVLYEMIAGRAPFSGEYEAALIYSIVHEQHEPLRLHRADVPSELDGIVSKCLAKEPEDRYQSADDLKRDLMRLKGGGQAGMASQPTRQRKILAVLPFENLGPRQEEYFADGMTEEITSRLAAVRGLGVISRTSAMRYKGTHKSLREIGADLKAQYVLEGTVRWDRGGNGNGRVRITPQLIQVSDDTHLWSERYDRVIDDIFAIQSDIAEQVVRQLNVALPAPERRILEAKPTDDPDAYQAYLRGMAYAGRPDYAADDFRPAIRMFERAISLDPSFASAYAELSMTHSNMYFHGHDRTEGRLSEAKAAVDRAFELDPDLVEAHLALGLYYYRGYQDWDRALAELAVVERRTPNDSRVLAVIAAIKKRRGSMDSAIEHFKEAWRWSPRDAGLPHEIGCVHMTMRNYEEAERYYDLSISLAPDQTLAYVCKAWNRWLGHGDTEGSGTALGLIPTRPDQDSAKSAILEFERIRQEIFARDYEEALKLLAHASAVFDEGQWWFTPKALLEGHIYRVLGRTEEARCSYEAASGLLEREVELRPNDDRVRGSLGIAYAGLGRRDRAIGEGKRGTELVPVSRNAVVGPFRVEDLALIYAMVGEHDLAFDQLEYLLSMPAWFSTSLLQIVPWWDPLREHPRYEGILKAHSKAGCR